MTDDEEQQLDQIIADYLQAQENGEPVSEDAVLAAHPGLADDLREFFDDLGEMNRLASPLATPMMSRQPVLGKLRYFGDYELLEEIARGGMGIVYKARQSSLNRIVAVKLILSGHLASETDVKRFQTEAESAANLQHPHIVSVHEVGRYQGQSYFSMQYIDGKNLSEIVRDHPLPPKQAAGYVREVAEAIHYAHQQGTLHRDLKPSNVLIDQNDRVQITDFGLAMKVEGNSELTRTGQVLGTPSYMPPEQAQHKRGLIGPASDIYSIGAVLYELVTGRAPFQADSPVETLRQVIETEPLSPRLLNPAVPKDLETICLKCLQKEPHKRYATAQHLADDLDRFVQGEPILAQPIGRIGRAWRWCRRRPLIAGLSATVAVLAAGITTVSTVGYFEIRSAWQVAKQQADEIEQHLYYSEMNRAANAAQDPDGLLQVSGILNKWRERGDHDRRGWEWYHLNTLLHQEVVSFNAHDGNVTDVQWSPNGEWLASAGNDGTVKIWANDGCEIRTLRGHSGRVNSLKWINGGLQIATAGQDGTIRIWDVDSEEPPEVIPQSGEVVALAWSQNRQQLAATIANTTDSNKLTSTVTVWNDGNWQAPVILGPVEGRCERLCWHPTRDQIAAGSSSRCVKVMDCDSGEGLNDFDGEFADWSHDGSMLATGVLNRLSVFEDHQKSPAITVTSPNIRALAWSPREPVLAFITRRRLVKLYDARRKQEVCTLRGDQPNITAICWHPQGHRIATSGIDGDISIWDTRNRSKLAPGAAAISWNPQGTRYVSRIRKEVVICNPQTSSIEKHLGEHTYVVYAVAWSPDGNKIASASYDGEVRISDANTGQIIESVKTEILQTQGPSKLPTILDWSPDGRKLAFSYSDKTVGLVDAQQPHRIQLFEGHSNKLLALAWNPDGSRFAAVDDRDGGRVLIWNPETHQIVRSINVISVNAVSWSPDGKLIAGACGDGNTRLWNVESGDLVRQLYGHSTYVQTVAWHPDGKRIASAAESGSVCIWDPYTGDQALRLLYDGGVPMIAWTSDGKSLAAAGYGGQAAVKIWRSELDRASALYW